jgi:hypothetical protein
VSKKKPLFIHVPKAGGMSIYGIFKNYNKDLPICLHRPVKSYPKAYRDSCFVFSFVRNPYDRLVSAYKYLTGGHGNGQDTKFGKTLSLDFKCFVKNQLNNNLNWLHFKPMVHFLNDDIDFIGRMENYDHDFKIVCNEIGISCRKLPHKNKVNHKHYTGYYDDETREIVAKKYARDIELFGYKFEEYTSR